MKEWLKGKWFRFVLSAIGTTIFFSSVSIAQAEILVKGYKKSLERKDKMIIFYVGSVGTGMSWANSKLEHEGRAPIYCEPREFVLEDDNYIRILNDEIERWEKAAKDKSDFQKIQDFPIELILLEGLERTFPCDQK